MKDVKNSLLQRREISLLIEAEKNPGFASALKEVAGHFKAPEEQVAIKNVRSKFGSRDFVIEAFIYDSLEQRNKVEPKPKVKKKAEGA